MYGDRNHIRQSIIRSRATTAILFFLENSKIDAGVQHRLYFLNGVTLYLKYCVVRQRQNSATIASCIYPGNQNVCKTGPPQDTASGAHNRQHRPTSFHV